ncbi:phage tail terminator protein [Psychrobacter pygoscelis]|uniref:phage tail terminator protein n=1 Tax=Psychrobacter pygoscelis TaxID=2488563 RepID=UPI001038971C|nr:hypothetical protein [Psychrobacter pygoscelis]
MTDNYFATGLGLIEHLRAMQSEWGVKTVETVAAVNQINKNITPALYVVNTSNNPTDTVEGMDSMDTQQWTVVVAVSHAAAQTNTTELMKIGGELITKVINHVQGYAVDDYHLPLKRVRTAGRPEYFSTFGLYPFTFETQFTP